jgi:hypothetical protein
MDSYRAAFVPASIVKWGKHWVITDALLRGSLRAQSQEGSGALGAIVVVEGVH